MILLLDHDDSFVFTLAGYVVEAGGTPVVVRVDALDGDRIAAMAPSHIVLSPGPRTPRDCPLAIEVVRRFGASIPILGVCLGHQCIAAAFGARVERTSHPTHGEASSIRHDGGGVFAGLPAVFRAGRYHSLAVVAPSVPAELRVCAHADDGDVMGIRHRQHQVHGVQFHPESILTEFGHRIVANFLAMAPLVSAA